MDSENTKSPAALLVVGGSQVFTFNKPVITIGRAEENDIVLEQSQVSRKHAELRYQGEGFEIVDLKSTGGTFVNGEKITKHSLSKGDVITLSNVHILFGQDEFPEPKITLTPQHKSILKKKQTTKETDNLYFKGKRTQSK